jgi:hypothetical protein
MVRPGRRNSTTSQSPLDRFLARLMQAPSPELRHAVKLISEQIRLLRSADAPTQTPSTLKKDLQRMGKTARSLRRQWIVLQWKLRAYPSLRGVLHGQFGLFSASGPDRLGRVHDTLDRGISPNQLGQFARNAAWQHDHLTLDRLRVDPAAEGLCAVAMVDLMEMTGSVRPAQNAETAWESCERLWLLSGGRASRSRSQDPARRGDPLSRWEWHLRWALGPEERMSQYLEAKRIVSVAFAKARFFALAAPGE